MLSEESTPGWHPEIEDASTGRLFLLGNLLLNPAQRQGSFGWTEGYTHSGQFIVGGAYGISRAGNGCGSWLMSNRMDCRPRMPGVWEIAKLSDGQQQRTQVARALAQDAGFILLDEPTNHLDLPHQHRLLRHFAHEAHHSAGVLVALHDLASAARYWDRMIGCITAASWPPARPLKY